MSSVAVIGPDRVVEGFALAGVEVLPASTPEEARTAFEGLGADTAVLFLTEEAAQALVALLPSRRDVIWTTLPG
jgi:vacuolar-type H+-ATPase subunit F/Vma7